MERSELVEIIMEAVVQVYRVKREELLETTNLPETFGTKSMQQLALCASLENEIDLVISIGDLGKYPTIGELADFILENQL